MASWMVDSALSELSMMRWNMHLACSVFSLIIQRLITRSVFVTLAATASKSCSGRGMAISALTSRSARVCSCFRAAWKKVRGTPSLRAAHSNPAISTWLASNEPAFSSRPVLYSSAINSCGKLRLTLFFVSAAKGMMKSRRPPLYLSDSNSISIVCGS